MVSGFDITGKRILVTGASSGIGKEIAAHCARSGAHVVATGRDEARLAAVLASFEGSDHSSFAGDLLDASVRDALVGSLPELDGVVHSAGVNVLRPFKFLDQKNLEAVTRVNFDAPMLLTSALLKKKKMAAGGSIIFIASISGLIGAAGYTAYAASKGALIAGTRVMALELAAQKIRVNCISPGIVRTPLLDSMAESADFSEKEKLHPLGFGSVEDVAHSAHYLISSASQWVTGSNLVIDGGYTAH